ncbi:MAG: hypothetical protein GXP34_03000 [Actinobacteria bacterium]|nr:hypothetical protein [Actinomycetota bacterium]
MSGGSSPSIGLSRGLLVGTLERLRLVRSGAEGVEPFYGVAAAGALVLFEANFGFARTPHGLGPSVAAP